MVIDHIIYAHPDLDAAAAEIGDRFGVNAAGGGQHPGKGTHNRVLGLGSGTYLEMIAPDPRQPEPSEPRPYGVEGITRGQLVGWALACDDIEGAVERARSAGFDPGGVVDGQRISPTGELLQWRVSRNAHTAGLVPFLSSWGDSSHPAIDAPPGLVLLSVHLEHAAEAYARRILLILDSWPLPWLPWARMSRFGRPQSPRWLRESADREECSRCADCLAQVGPREIRGTEHLERAGGHVVSAGAGRPVLGSRHGVALDEVDAHDGGRKDGADLEHLAPGVDRAMHDTCWDEHRGAGCHRRLRSSEVDSPLSSFIEHDPSTSCQWRGMRSPTPMRSRRTPNDVRPSGSTWSDHSDVGR
ncbi:MAG TPA: VOC family protein [Mycobacteriales bacterium]|nr:VOC family protein [Mycobacteriales bacterium]